MSSLVMSTLNMCTFVLALIEIKPSIQFENFNMYTITRQEISTRNRLQVECTNKPTVKLAHMTVVHKPTLFAWYHL